jgi:hypothetical protein
VGSGIAAIPVSTWGLRGFRFLIYSQGQEAIQAASQQDSARNAITFEVVGINVANWHWLKTPETPGARRNLPAEEHVTNNFISQPEPNNANGNERYWQAEAKQHEPDEDHGLSPLLSLAFLSSLSIRLGLAVEVADCGSVLAIALGKNSSTTSTTSSLLSSKAPLANPRAAA